MSYTSRAPPIFLSPFFTYRPVYLVTPLFIVTYSTVNAGEMDAGASLEFREIPPPRVYMCTCIIWNSNLDRPPDLRDVILLIFTTLSFVRSAHSRSLLAPDSITRLSRASRYIFAFNAHYALIARQWNVWSTARRDYSRRIMRMRQPGNATHALICVLHNKHSTSITM